MTNQSSLLDIRTYALAGAQARLTEINAEAEAIRQAFPELRNGASSRSRVAPTSEGDPSPSPSPRRSRPTMSAAQRKAVGERMKKYWAARRSGSQATGTGSDSATTAAPVARGGAKPGTRTMSPEARKRISDAQKARWAKRRGEGGAGGSESSKTSAKAKSRRASKPTTRGTAKRRAGKRSAAARKRMSEAQKKRWAAKRASH